MYWAFIMFRVFVVLGSCVMVLLGLWGGEGWGKEVLRMCFSVFVVFQLEDCFTSFGFFDDFLMDLLEVMKVVQVFARGCCDVCW